MLSHEEKIYRKGFLEGIIEGITMYAIWKNGRQVVGCLEKPLKEVLAEYKAELEKLKSIP